MPKDEVTSLGKSPPLFGTFTFLVSVQALSRSAASCVSLLQPLVVATTTVAVKNFVQLVRYLELSEEVWKLRGYCFFLQVYLCLKASTKVWRQQFIQASGVCPVAIGVLSQPVMCAQQGHSYGFQRGMPYPGNSARICKVPRKCKMHYILPT